MIQDVVEAVADVSMTAAAVVNGKSISDDLERTKQRLYEALDRAIPKPVRSGWWEP